MLRRAPWCLRRNHMTAGNFDISIQTLMFNICD
ncbi:hypothetical protein SBA1_190077 [Candidatus Sulfotelmatobacter kueseliae]|uniref:Uncharacterized protein n=1 Tax=Candidatus Sulfotelmatobacter kueseliae TaxID=2042962 RepID=A0A2U3KE44_9BACT|nr:hypothetical protein SBA1_190077 [Candidatus Sulfotelmatobacter kueseliae]